MANSSNYNIRVHASQIPEFFSKQLKSFIIKQPDFNEELSEKLTSSNKAMEILTEKLNQISQHYDGVSKELVSIQQQLASLNKG